MEERISAAEARGAAPGILDIACTNNKIGVLFRFTYSRHALFQFNLIEMTNKNPEIAFFFLVSNPGLLCLSHANIPQRKILLISPLHCLHSL